MEFKDRLKAARRHAALNQAELALRAGLTQASISDLERGKSRASAFVARLASVCGVSPFWLADGTGSMLGTPALPAVELRDEDSPARHDEADIPFLREVERATGCFSIEQDPHATLRFTRKDLQRCEVATEAARCISVRGNSMLPVLRDGATVAIDTRRHALAELVDGDLYALSHNGQLRIKQLYRQPTGLRLRSFNRDEHPDEHYNFEQLREEGIEILGHVFWWGMFAR